MVICEGVRKLRGMGVCEGFCTLRGLGVGVGGGRRCDVWLLGEAVDGGGED